MAMFGEKEELSDSDAEHDAYSASLCDKILDDNLELDGFEEEISSTDIVELETSTAQISTSGIETTTNTLSDEKVEGSKLNEMFEVALGQEKAEDPTGSTQKKPFAFPRMPRPVKVNPPFEPFENRSREVKVEDPNLVSDSFGRIVEKKYSRCHWYAKNTGNFGANFLVMTGDRIDTGSRSNRVLSVADKMKMLMAKFTKGVGEQMFPMNKQSPPKSEWNYGQPPPSEPADWLIQWTPEKLENLETLDIQKNICAALNSRLKMRWLIGVERGLVKGCLMDRRDRDLIGNAFSYAVTREFVPDLDLDLISLKFHIVSDGGETFDKEGKFKAIIEIAVTSKTNAFYQLSSGRCFYLHGGNVCCGNIEKFRKIWQDVAINRENAESTSTTKASMSRTILTLLAGFVGGFIVAKYLIRKKIVF